MATHNFDINAFDNLPNSLKKSDYTDMLLFLINLKPCVRLGSNNDAVYNSMKRWCESNGFSYVVSSEHLMYISKTKLLAKITQVVDDSVFKHSYVLGRLLGYPRCCCKKISSVGENEIDLYEKTLCENEKFIPPFDIINPIGYKEGYSLIAHVPCCSTCKRSLKIARRAKRIIFDNQKNPNMDIWKGYWIKSDNRNDI
jgi:hypothetical protein